MGRRRNDNGGLFELVIKLVALAFVLTLISPQARQWLAALGQIAFCILFLSGIGLLGFVIYRVATRSQRQSHTDAVLEFRNEALRPATGSGQNRIDIHLPPETFAQLATADLIQELRTIDWFQFEKLVAAVYRKLGYAVSRRGGANPDGGIDLVIEKDGQQAAVQCKQWKQWNVGVKSVREFLGALTDAGIQKGIFITLCGYTGEAKQLAEKHGIEIINETGLAAMLESTSAKTDTDVLGILRDTRKICPKCEREMVLRTATKGLNAGNQFWGCSAYPRCRYTMPV